MEGFKFEVGQMVKHKLSETQPIMVLEKNAQFCYGGLRQNWYLCVLGVTTKAFSPLQFEPEKRYKFMEIELEEIVKS